MSVNPSERYLWIDTVRGFAVLVVALLHTGPIYDMFTSAKPEFMSTMSFAAPWRQSILMFVSGFLLPRAFARDTQSFVLGKARHLAWPFVLWTLLYCVALGQPEKILTLSPWVGGTYLWYFLFLGINFAVAFLLRPLGWPVLMAYSFTLAMLMPDGSKYGERLFLLMGMFFAGGCAGERSAQFLAIVSSWRALILLPIGILLSAWSLWLQTPGAVNGNSDFALLYLAAIVGLFALAARIQRFRVAAVLNYVGRQSIVFYLVHLPAYVLLMRAGLADVVTNPILALVVMAVIGIGSAALLCELRDRFVLVDRLFAGPDFEKMFARAREAASSHG